MQGLKPYRLQIYTIRILFVTCGAYFFTNNFINNCNKLNYNKITELTENKRLSIPQLAQKIGMSKRGLYMGIKENSLRIDTLEKIAEALEVPVTVFFDVDRITQLENIATDTRKLKEEIENTERIKELQDSIKDKKSIINLTFSHVLTALNLYKEFVNEVKPNYNELSDQDRNFIESFETKIIDRLKLIIKSSDSLLNMYDLDSLLNVSIKPDIPNKKDVFISVTVNDKKQLKNKENQEKEYKP